MDKLKQLRASFKATGLSGIRLGTTYTDVTLRTNAELVEWAAAAGATLTTTTVNDRCWDGYETTLDDLPCYVTGPHRAAQGEAA